MNSEAHTITPRQNGKRAGAPLDWQAPADMLPAVRDAWRKFYGSVWVSYGITSQQYRDLYIAQHGCCYICRKAKGKNPDDPKGRGGRRLGVDHNHVTGAVRGLLCTGGDKTCNRIIGWLSSAALRRAVEYVETEPAQTVLAIGREPFALGEDRDTVMRAALDLS